MQKADCISLFKPRRSKFAFLQPLTKKITPARKVLIEIKQPILSFHEEKNYRFLFEQKVFHKKTVCLLFSDQVFFLIDSSSKIWFHFCFFCSTNKKNFFDSILVFRCTKKFFRSRWTTFGQFLLATIEKSLMLERRPTVAKKGDNEKRPKV